ncbi:MAG: alanine/ornithine racemase family PLP-dependent enzyme [Promethearchaeota archaeon]
MPRLEIDLKKIFYNAKRLNQLFNSKNISIIGITKVTLGDPTIAKTLVDAGIQYLGDSRIPNIKRMKEAGVNAQFVMIRSPALSEIPSVVKHADISLNSEIEVIKRLSAESTRQNKKHGILLMVEMGDLREGLMPDEVDNIVKQVLELKGVELCGIGTNLKCFAGVSPDERNMKEFSDIAKKIQEKFNIKFKFISGGNSANYDWLMNTKDVGLINNLRIGTAILLGHGGINEAPIPGLQYNAFTFIAEIVELRKKPSYPKGTINTNAFGEPSIFLERNYQKGGERVQALLNAGRQDILEMKLIPKDNIEIMCATSDYIVVDVKENKFKVGDEMRFNLEYEALLCAMTSPFVLKVFI